MTVSDWGPDSPAGDGRDAAGSGPTVAAPVRTPIPADTEERDGREALSDDLRRQLAAIIAHPKMPADVRRFAGTDECDRCTGSLDVADAVIKAGFRLVSEDDATVRLVATALAGEDGWVVRWPDNDDDLEEAAARYLCLARAAVRALREANCQSAPSSSQAGSSTAHTCCEHCTNRTGSCVRCGVRDAEAWELCGPCDREVEAEATGRALREAGAE